MASCVHIILTRDDDRARAPEIIPRKEVSLPAALGTRHVNELLEIDLVVAQDA